MARARNIKPSFFQNEDLAELTPITRLAFIGMWTIADFKGCIEFRPKRLKVQLMPYDECDFEEIAINLDRSGLISIYSVAGQRYIKITNFEKHQNPHKNERDSGSDIPDYAPEASVHAGSQTIAINPDKDGTAPADSLLLNPSSLIPESNTPQAVCEYTPEFEIAWSGYPQRPGANKKKALKAWNARLKAGVDFTQMTLGVDRYAYYVLMTRTEPQFIKQPETFFGPDEHYLSKWEVPAQKVMPRNSPMESIDAINARNNAEAKRLLFGTPTDMRTINA